MGPNERAAMALTAMKAIGISEKRVKPVLKSLLRLYDKNWEPIEDENYRVLIDAIFEQENEVEEEEPMKSKEVEFHDALPDPPLTRTRLRSQPDRPPPTDEAPLKRPKIEGDNLPIARKTRRSEPVIISSHEIDEEEQEMPVALLAPSPSGLDSEEPSQTVTGDIIEHEPVSPKPLTRSKGKEPVSSLQITCRKDMEMEPTSSQLIHRDKGARSGRSSLGVCFKEPKVEPGIIILRKEKSPEPQEHVGLIEPKNEPGDDYLPFEVPIAIMPPPNPGQTIDDDPLYEDGCPTANGSTGKVNGVESLVSKDKNVGVVGRACKAVTTSEFANVPETPEAVTSSELVNVPEAPTSFEIASSPSGEVKISLNCNQAFERPDFRIPSLDAVLKAVEDKCLRSYRILEPNFSMMKLMQEMCQSFLDLSNKSTDPREESLIRIAPEFEFLKKSNLRSAFGSNGGQQDNIGTLANLSNGGGGTEGNDPDCRESQSLVVIQQQNASIDDLRPFHDVNDISKGEEKVRISLINEASSESHPPRFYYIPRNIVYQNAYVNFSLARIGDEDCCSNCFGDCLSSSIPCACARETGGEFAYTLEGLVKEKFLNECISMNRDPQQHNHYYCKECPLERSKEGSSEPCKGHLVRKFIKECWSKCGCNMQCGNRVVQRGIACNLQVFLTSEGKGWGLRTLEDLPKGTFVCEYVGEILTNTELYDRNMRSSGNEKHTYPVLLDADWGSEGVLKDEEALCLDATYYGNVARFINHRCFDATLVEIPVEIETPDHHYYHLAFFTTRKVDALEELNWDYGIDFDDHNHPVKAFRCLCGSKCCRDMKRSHRSKSRR